MNILSSPPPSPPVDSALVRALLGGDFAVTAEINPPISGDGNALLDMARPLRDHVHALNVMDGAGGKVRMSGVTAAALLAVNGIEPIVEINRRDRNRVAVLGDLIGASALGVRNVVVHRGDDMVGGDYPDAKAVFDLESQDMIRLVSDLAHKGVIGSDGVNVTTSGISPRAITVEGQSPLFVGAMDVPHEALEGGFRQIAAKADAGAQFVQTRLCFDMDVIEAYVHRLREEGISERLFVLIGTAPLTSARMATWMRDTLWGTLIPDSIVDRLEGAVDQKKEGLAICAEHLQQLSEMRGISGVHVIAPTNPEDIPGVLDTAGVRPIAA